MMLLPSCGTCQMRVHHGCASLCYRHMCSTKCSRDRACKACKPRIPALLMQQQQQQQPFLRPTPQQVGNFKVVQMHEGGHAQTLLRLLHLTNAWREHA